MNLVEIFLSVIKAVGLLIVIVLANIQFFWSISGIVGKVLEFFGI